MSAVKDVHDAAMHSGAPKDTYNGNDNEDSDSDALTMTTFDVRRGMADLRKDVSRAAHVNVHRAHAKTSALECSGLLRQSSTYHASEASSSKRFEKNTSTSTRSCRCPGNDTLLTKESITNVH